MNSGKPVANLSCPICQNRLKGENEQFCAVHQAAFENIQDCYPQWTNAYGSITMKEYVSRLAGNENSGEWVIEVARYLLEKESMEKL